MPTLARLSLETPEKVLPPRFRLDPPDRVGRDTKPARLRWQCPWHDDPDAQSNDENKHPDARVLRERREKVGARLTGFKERSERRERYEPDATYPLGWRSPAPEPARLMDSEAEDGRGSFGGPVCMKSSSLPTGPDQFFQDGSHGLGWRSSAPESPGLLRSEKPAPVVRHEGVDMVLDPSVPLRVECVTGAVRTVKEERPWDISVVMQPLTLASLPRNRRTIAPALRPALRFLAMTTLPLSRYGRVLPPARDPNALTLVLDLDETLVHCDKGLGLIRRNVHVRPHARSFLRACATHEVIVFTASTQGYADSVLDQLDPDRTLVHHRLYRDTCSVNEHGGYFKDLNVLGRNLDKVVLVDNSLTSLALQPDNGIPCRTWTEDPEDRELLDLIPIIKELDRQPRVQPTLRAKYRLGEFFDVLRSPLAAPLLCELSDLD